MPFVIQVKTEDEYTFTKVFPKEEEAAAAIPDLQKLHTHAECTIIKLYLPEKEYHSTYYSLNETYVDANIWEDFLRDNKLCKPTPRTESPFLFLSQKYEEEQKKSAASSANSLSL